MAAAPARFPEEVQPLDFDAFFHADPTAGELMGTTDFTVGGRKRRVPWVKTTESAIEYGQRLVSFSP